MKTTTTTKAATKRQVAKQIEQVQAQITAARKLGEGYGGPVLEPLMARMQELCEAYEAAR